MLRRILALACCSAALTAWGDTIGAPLGTPDQPMPDVREWKEMDAPPPPALRTSGLIPIEVPGTSLQFGVDPGSVAVGSDEVVRYVVVAKSSSGAVNAMYEGLNCSSGEVRVYAHYNPQGNTWVNAPDSSWRPLNTARTSYSLQIARNGACAGQAPNGSKEQIVRDLKSGVDRRFLKY